MTIPSALNSALNVVAKVVIAVLILSVASVVLPHELWTTSKFVAMSGGASTAMALNSNAETLKQWTVSWVSGCLIAWACYLAWAHFFQG